MAGSSNFQLWNPTQANQDSDLQYNTDAQRVGGAPNGVPFPSMTGNKLFYQLSTAVWALMTMMANKGFNVSDANPSTLASVLAAIQTTADAKLPTQIISGATGNITLNAAQYSNFEIGLSGSVVVTFTGQQAGQIIGMNWSQPPGGNCLINIPKAVGETWYDYTGSASSSMLFLVMADGSFRAFTPGVSGSGINGTPIGASIPSSGVFSTLLAAAATIANLAVSGNSTFSGTVTVSNSVQGVVFYGLQGAEFSGHSFVGDPTTGLQSAGLSTLRLVCAGVTGISLSNSVVSIALPTTFASTVSLGAGGNLAGNFTGSPNFTGAPTSSTPVSTDSSTRVATTGWVQALFAAMGAAFSIGGDGFIKLPSFLGGITIQWGIGGATAGGTFSFNWPFAFPTNVFTVILTPYSTTNNAIFLTLLAYSRTAITYSVDGSGSTSAMFFAIGN